MGYFSLGHRMTGQVLESHLAIPGCTLQVKPLPTGMGITPIPGSTSVCRVPILLPPPAPQSCIQPYLQTTRVPFVPSHSQPSCDKTGHKKLIVSKSFRTPVITLAAFLSQEPRRVKTPSLFTSSQVIFCLCWLLLHSSRSALTCFFCCLMRLYSV